MAVGGPDGLFRPLVEGNFTGQMSREVSRFVSFYALRHTNLVSGQTRNICIRRVLLDRRFSSALVVLPRVPYKSRWGALKGQNMLLLASKGDPLKDIQFHVKPPQNLNVIDLLVARVQRNRGKKKCAHVYW